MLPADTLKASHDSNRMDFMWQGNIFVVPYFSIRTEFKSLRREFSLAFGPLSLGWSLMELPYFRMKDWMLWCSICISARSSKWVSYPSKITILLLKGEVLHTLENWVMALSHTYLSIYKYCVWWTVQSSAMLKWIYLEYSLAWRTMMGGMKNFPSAQVKTSNVNHNSASSPFWTSYIISPWNNL